MSYAEFAPSAALAPWVECYWTFGPLREPFERRVLPDGCADLLFADGSMSAVGTMTAPLVIRDASSPAYFGVRFRPGRALLGLPLAELTNQRVTLRGDLGDRVAEQPTTRGRIALLESHLLARLPVPDRAVDAAVARIVAGHSSIERIAADIGVTRQHLARKFLQRVGVSPKTFARVARFRRVLADARASRAGEWSAIAADYGYADQSHLIAEFREFAGTSPVPFFLSR